jgi:hypothetical protein
MSRPLGWIIVNRAEWLKSGSGSKRHKGCRHYVPELGFGYMVEQYRGIERKHISGTALVPLRPSFSHLTCTSSGVCW